MTKTAERLQRGTSVKVDDKYDAVILESIDVAECELYEVRIFDGIRVVGTRVASRNEITVN
jgi:hypothetical protein